MTNCKSFAESFAQLITHTHIHTHSRPSNIKGSCAGGCKGGARATCIVYYYYYCLARAYIHIYTRAQAKYISAPYRISCNYGGKSISQVRYIAAECTRCVYIHTRPHVYIYSSDVYTYMGVGVYYVYIECV